jgi:hypothetical protein
LRQDLKVTAMREVPRDRASALVFDKSADVVKSLATGAEFPVSSTKNKITPFWGCFIFSNRQVSQLLGLRQDSKVGAMRESAARPGWHAFRLGAD